MPNEYKFQITEQDQVFEFGLREPEKIDFKISEAIEIVHAEPYEGEYTVTPSAETQVLETNGLQCIGDITINPIPSNYGLITWDGSTLTVS